MRNVKSKSRMMIESLIHNEVKRVLSESRRGVLSEAFNLKNAVLPSAKTGKKYNVVYFDLHSSPNLKQYKDILNKYGAKWLGGNIKSWGWFVTDGKEQEVRNQYIQPCIEELEATQGEGGSSKEEIISAIDQTMAALQSGNVPQAVALTSQEVLSRLDQFKKELMQCVSADEFKQKFAAVLALRRALGWRVSLNNTLLIFIQKPDARLVKSRTRWANFNRTIKPDATPIILLRPNIKEVSGSVKKKGMPAVIQSLEAHFGKTQDKWTKGEQEIADVMKSKMLGGKFLGYAAYEAFDVTDTEQIEGTEDEISDILKPQEEIEWFDKSDEETDLLKKLVPAMEQVIEDNGIALSRVSAEVLGGARGRSMNGSIEILDKRKCTLDIFNTLCHEFAHEILHQRFLKSNNPAIQDIASDASSRGIIEQQAEICAWIVERFFGMDNKTGINYAGNWGISEDNAIDIFNSVAYASNYIIDELNERIGNNTDITESKMFVEAYVTPEDVAELLGLEDLYRQCMAESVKYRFLKLV